jgi:hypothetical protein
MWPIVVNNKPIGIFYADRKTSGRELGEQTYSQFKLFCQQAPLALLKIHMNLARNAK